VPWGIVTNKATRFAVPLVAALGLAERAAALVCGDTVAHSKPHPAPLLEAARRLGRGTRRAAPTSATTGATSTPAAPPGCSRSSRVGVPGRRRRAEAWGADHLIARPDELPGLIGGA
jgi:phosphoglycolate phosphatase